MGGETVRKNFNLYEVTYYNEVAAAILNLLSK